MEKDEVIYIGDGIYAKFDGYQVEVWTTDGIHKEFSIFFNYTTAEDLMTFFRKCFS